MSDSQQRTNLGRGLAALFGEESEDYATLDKLRATKDVPIGHLHPNPRQPRRSFDEAAARELAESVKAQGVLQPILVRRHPELASEFEIVAGERRWRAAQLAQLHEVPVVIRDLSDAQSRELALVENVQRQDLGPLEEAQAYQRLIEEFGNSQDDVARAVGKSRSHVANTLRLLTLPDPVKDMLADQRISAGHARAVLGARDPEAVARKVVAQGLNVRQTEGLARAQKQEETQAKPKAPSETAPAGVPRVGKDPDTVALESDLSARLGLKVTIDFHGKGGCLSFHYETLEQLDDLLHRLDHPTRSS
ncbi:MAG: ParB/RepB/Spo0J family partition protein [Rhodospirillales bacterium]|nr:ParB/RepB/Spo0J family partition protein [Rhodospirillales bacterium]